MASIPPFVRQESTDACPIACLRMILAFRGITVTEPALMQAADIQPGGLNPEQIAELASRYGLTAKEKQLDQDALFELIRQARFPIVILYRRPIDAVDAGHAVIPVSITRRFVTFLDPLLGKRRVTIRKFEESRRLAGQWVAVWETSS